MTVKGTLRPRASTGHIAGGGTQVEAEGQPGFHALLKIRRGRGSGNVPFGTNGRDWARLTVAG